jgi:hypothetical protein
MATLADRVFHGARARMFYNSVQVGHMTNLQWQKTYETFPVVECGSDIVQAHVIMGYTVSVSCEAMHITDEDFYQQGIMPSGEEGGVIGWPEATIVVYDTVTGTAQEEIQGCVPTQESSNLAARSPCMRNVSWNGRIIKPRSQT